MSLLLFLVLIVSSGVKAQNRVSGIVKGRDGEPLSGATIKVKGTSRAAFAAADGTFNIEATVGNILEISSIGYKPREMTVEVQGLMNIFLAEMPVNLDEVLVTGYTTQRIKDIAGSISSVKPRDLTSIPAGTADQMLQGRAAGLTVINSGEPGTPVTIRIHGLGNFGDFTPLYIIDGVQGDINSLNPDDIESLQVLKDAGSYSIYGVRGANGVIVITTRKGKPGKVKINYDMYLGVTTPLKGPNYLDPQGYADLLWMAKRNSNNLVNGNPQDPYYGNGLQPLLPDYIQAGPHFDTLYEGNPLVADDLYNLNPDNPPVYQIVKFSKSGTDWYRELFRPAFSQNHTVSISGGSEKNQYLVSLGFLDQQGTFVNTRLQRYSIRVNNDFTAFNNFHFGENLQLSYSSNPKSAKMIPGVSSDDIQNTINTSPAQPVYDTHGAYNGMSTVPNFSGPANNPLGAREFSKDNKDKKWGVFGNVYAGLDFARYFNIRTSFGGSFEDHYNYAFSYGSYDNSAPNRYSEASGYNSSWTWTNTLSYNRIFREIHNLKFLLGTEMIENYGRELGGSSINLPFSNPNYWLLTNGEPAVPPNYSLSTISKLSSFFSRLDYSYKGKYVLTATLRRDGSSVFGPQNRFGWFPAIAGAWRMSEEKFMNKIEWITDLKIRASWGKTGFYGNTDPFNQYNLYGGTASSAFYDIFGNSTGTIQRGYTRVRIGNAKTGWQEDLVTNIGVDAILWNGKLSVSADIYKKESKGLLFQVALPDILGDATAPNVNTGDIRNTGIDLTIGSKGRFSRNWKWDVLLTFTHYRNEIIKLNKIPYFDDLFGSIRNEVGYPIGSFFGYKIVGIFSDTSDVAKSPVQDGAAPGRFKYLDNNGRDASGKLTGKPDGRIDDADRVHYASPHPDFTLGLNLAVYFRNFDLSTFFYGSFGNSIYNFTKANVLPPFTGSIGAVYPAALYDSWTPTHKNTSIPRAETDPSFSTSGTFNSFSVEDGSYLRNKSLILGYSFPRSLIGRFKLDRLRVYLQVTNLFTLTHYSGLDPEVYKTPLSPLAPEATNSAFGVDGGRYPTNQKQYLVGINLGI